MAQIHMYVGQSKSPLSLWYWMGLTDDGVGVQRSGFGSKELAEEAAKKEQFKKDIEKVYHFK